MIIDNFNLAMIDRCHIKILSEAEVEKIDRSELVLTSKDHFDYFAGKGFFSVVVDNMDNIHGCHYVVQWVNDKPIWAQVHTY